MFLYFLAVSPAATPITARSRCIPVSVRIIHWIIISHRVIVMIIIISWSIPAGYKVRSVIIRHWLVTPIIRIRVPISS